MRQEKEIADRLSEIERRIDADPELVTDDMREKIKARAREHVRKKAAEKLEDRIFAEEVRRAEVEYAEPDEALMEITIDLPDFAYMIAIDGVGYYHGCTYDVPTRKYRSMIDQMARSWEHNREIHGDRRKGDVTMRPMNRRISGLTGAVTTTDSMRASARH